MMAEDLPGGHDPKDDGEESDDVTEIVLDSEAISAPRGDDVTQILPMRSTPKASQDLPGTVIGIAGTTTDHASVPSETPAMSQSEQHTPTSEDAATKILFEPPTPEPKPDNTSQDDPSGPATDDDEGPKTVLLPPVSKSVAGDDFNPPVGWLVIIDGPGRGAAVAIQYGQNTIGRGDDQRVRLNFGDTRIARETHAYVIYDEIERTFFLRDTGKANLVRLNTKPVMAPTKLCSHDQIVIGETTLLFVPLCNDAFDWLGEEDDPVTGPGEESK